MGLSTIDLFRDSFARVPERIVLDIDDTPDAVHGGQQLALFSAHYNGYCFQFKSRATAAYQAPSRAIARDLADGIVADFETELPSAVACFMDDFEACIAHLRMPIPHRQAIRTTNLLERLFDEERPRLKIIPNAFGEKPVLKLMFGAMIRAAERWRAIKVTDFERRQMAAVRQELDQEYEARNGLASRPSNDTNQTKLSSTSRT
jgi:hypothetical protein